MSALILGIPSKGRLQEQASSYFADAGLAVAQAHGARGYVGRIAALGAVEVRFLSAGDIARAVIEGEVHLGVTGEDVLHEAATGPGVEPIVLRRLGFGGADLIVAAPTAWLDVEDVADLAEVAQEHRARTGRRLRVATKYVNLARSFFDRNGVEDYRIVESPGATEGAPAAGLAEIVVDITTTGATLAANQLKILAGGVILKSQACLAASEAALWTDGALDAARQLLAWIEARAAAKAQRLVRVKGPAGPVAAAAAAAGLTPADGESGAFYVPAERLHAAIEALAAAADGPIGAFSPEFVFDAQTPTFERLATRLKGLDTLAGIGHS
jgi:ATP phosphoribosyltransferase